MVYLRIVANGDKRLAEQRGNNRVQHWRRELPYMQGGQCLYSVCHKGDLSSVSELHRNGITVVSLFRVFRVDLSYAIII